MQCPKCKTELLEDVESCSKCGTEIIVNQNVVTVQDNAGVAGIVTADHAQVGGERHYGDIVQGDKIIYEGEKPISAGDMLSACQAQVESVIEDVRQKYDPELYVERGIEQELNTFFNTPFDPSTPNCFLLIAPAGSGKTNLLCHLAQERVTQQPTLLLMGGSLYLSSDSGLLGGVRTELEEASSKIAFRSAGDSLHSLHRLGEELDRDALLLIDAINEYEHPVEMRKALQEILRKTRGKRIKLLVTCRDYYWGLFKAPFWKGATVNILPVDGEEESGANADFNLFSAGEHEKALSLYLEHYEITGQPVGDAAEQCRHPLLLRFFCEAYRKQDVGQVEDIRLKELFDRYWDQKLVSITDRMIGQGVERLQAGLAQEIGDYLLSVAAYMLHKNVRAIPIDEMTRATQRKEQYDDPHSVYGRIRDEFIILEEKEVEEGGRNLQAAFVYEEFMEYVMARSLIESWEAEELGNDGIFDEIEKLTEKYTEFAQILGVMVYLALMLKDQRDLELWSLLLDKGEKWQKVVFEAFRKLPEEQLDSGLLSSLEEMLCAKDEGIQTQVLDLIKLERVGQAASGSPALVSNICELTKHKKEPIARRAVLALGYIRIEADLKVLIEALGHSKASVRANAVTALVRKGPLIVDTLIRALRTPDRRVRKGASQALMRLPELIEPILDEVLFGQNHPNWEFALPLLLTQPQHPGFSEIPSEIWEEFLGQSMVWVPPGSFLMGSDKKRGSKARDDKLSAHSLELPSYWIGRYPVTVSQWGAFIEDSNFYADQRALQDPDDHPVRYVNWHDAMAYCDWLSEKTELDITLPSEAEWEKAARGTDGRIYPWGDEFDPGKCNTSESGIVKTTPVGCYSPIGDSPYGCADMAGNVSEWMQSEYKKYPYRPDDGRENLDGNDARVLRGGSWCDSRGSARMSNRNRSNPNVRNHLYGFRLVFRSPSL
jgi:formylglycine-generating enzyme required for sulfatase activity